MTSKKEYIQLIDKLTELTQSGELEWDRKLCPDKLESTENKIDIVYTTELEGRNLRLYEEKYKHYTDEFDFYWADGLVLEFIDDSGGHIWQFPDLRNIMDLLKAVKFKEAGVDSFIKDVLGKNKP
jgi:hypothetical protein